MSTSTEKTTHLLKHCNCSFTNGIGSIPIVHIPFILMTRWEGVRRLSSFICSRMCAHIVFKLVDLGQRDEIVTSKDTLISMSQTVYLFHGVIPIHGMKLVRNKDQFIRQLTHVIRNWSNNKGDYQTLKLHGGHAFCIHQPGPCPKASLTIAWTCWRISKYASNAPVNWFQSWLV